VYSMLLALAIGVAGLPFPFVPRHLTLIGSLTIGIPAFFLALAPNSERARPGFVPRVLRFALPVGALAAAATFIGYYLAGFEPDVSRVEARTTATLVLAGVGLLVMVRLARPLTRPRRLLVAGIVVAFGLVMVVPRLGAFFALEMPPAIVVLAAVGLVALSGLVMAAVAAAVTWWVGRPRFQRFQRPSA
jgi:cation-transporting P-type ATPase E